MSLIANVNSGKKGKKFKQSDFHPLLDKNKGEGKSGGIPIKKGNIQDLKVFVDGKQRHRGNPAADQDSHAAGRTDGGGEES